MIERILGFAFAILIVIALVATLASGRDIAKCKQNGGTAVRNTDGIVVCVMPKESK